MTAQAIDRFLDAMTDGHAERADIMASFCETADHFVLAVAWQDRHGGESMDLFRLPKDQPLPAYEPDRLDPLEPLAHWRAG